MATAAYSGIAWGNRDGWEAICVDLDIAVQGDSFDEVYRLLNEAVQDYVEEVASLPEADRRRLLARKVPFWPRTRLLLGHWAASLVDAVRRGDGQHGSFPVSAAA